MQPARATNPRGRGFPVRFRIDVSDDPKFTAVATVIDQTGADSPDPVNRIQTFAAKGAKGRYVRVTATRLRQAPNSLRPGRTAPGGAPRYEFSLAKLDVLSEGKDIAEGRPIADSTKGELGITPLTRAPRPQGETIVTDNPGNVTAAQNWKPPARRVRVPRSGVRLEGGAFKTAFENNIGYLLSSFSVDELLKEFRERAGKPNPPNLPPPEPFWQEAIAGSNAGRFLMGAGNSLRWTDHPELRSRMNQVVAGISECKQPNGYIMAYPEDTIFQSERAAYTRAWVTHGLIEAGHAGNAQAFPLLRGFYDWFDHCQHLPRLLRGALQGVQGMIANTRMYLTPVGRPEDIQVISSAPCLLPQPVAQRRARAGGHLRADWRPDPAVALALAAALRTPHQARARAILAGIIDEFPLVVLGAVAIDLDPLGLQFARNSSDAASDLLPA